MCLELSAFSTPVLVTAEWFQTHTDQYAEAELPVHCWIDPLTALSKCVGSYANDLQLMLSVTVCHAGPFSGTAGT